MFSLKSSLWIWVSNLGPSFCLRVQQNWWLSSLYLKLGCGRETKLCSTEMAALLHICDLWKRFSQFSLWRELKWFLMELMCPFWRRGQSGAEVSHLLSSLFCLICGHNLFQHHYGNWEAIISERHKKAVPAQKESNDAGKSLLTSVRNGEWKCRQWIWIVQNERLAQLSVEFTCNLGSLIIWEFHFWDNKCDAISHL